MNVLSLFDGISCARVALARAGIPVKTYYAAEIDKNAIAVSTKNYPDIVRLGDVRAVESLPEPIDLLIGGSPCQDLSIAKKDRKGLAGDRSGLFWEYVRIKKALNPRWFILENVASMPKADRDTITREMGVEPVLFDAALVSAQSRKRLFWTNIPFALPPDRGIALKNILQPDGEVDESMYVTRPMTVIPRKEHAFIQVGYLGSKNECGVGGQALRVYDADGKSTTSGVGLYKIGHVGASDSQGNRVYSPEGKSSTLSANGGGLGAKTGLYKVGRDVGRRLNAEGHREDDNHDLAIQRRIELREDDKSGTLTSVQKDNLVVSLTPRQQTNLRDVDDKAHCLTSTNYKGSQANGTTLVESNTRIRKLTPIECERLQGLPDNYTEGIAKTNRYKCLGNAFNVDVIAHILRATT